MPRFVVEAYSTGGAIAEARERARRTAELGDGVVYLRTIYLPTDETVLHVFDAPSAMTLTQAGTNAKLAFQRIVEAVEMSEPRRR